MKSKITSLAVYILLIFLIGGCGESQPPAEEQDPGATARQAIEQAETRYRESQTAGHAWLQTRARLDEAKQALEAADFSAALAEAERAHALADASLAQAQAEQSAWRERFPITRPATQ